MTWEEMYAKAEELLSSKAPATARGYLGSLRLFEFTRTPDMEQIVKKTKEWIGEGKSPNSIIHYYAAVKWLFKNLPREFDPLDVQDIRNYMGGMKPSQEVAAFATKEQAEDVIAHSDPRTALAVAIMYYGGLRVSEVASLKLSYFTTESSQKMVNGKMVTSKDQIIAVPSKVKNRQARHVPVLPPLQAALKKYMNSYDRKDTVTRLNRLGIEYGDSLFLGDKGPLTDKTIQKNVTAICAKCGYPWLHDHSFRHWIATLLIQNGKSIATVKKVLGHESIASTMKYVHRSTADIADDMRGIL